jgi:hypothetical protein
MVPSIWEGSQEAYESFRKLLPNPWQPLNLKFKHFALSFLTEPIARAPPVIRVLQIFKCGVCQMLLLAYVSLY